MADDQRAKVIAKIARLKALSECKTGNKNEAATAAALMQRLMLEHRIETEELSRANDNGVMREPLGLRDKSFPPWKQHLITNLAKHNGCTPCGIGAPAHSVDVFGRAEDIALFRQIYKFVRDEIERLCLVWASQSCCERCVKQRREWKFGASCGVISAIKTEVETARKCFSTSALARIDQRFEEAVAATRELGIEATSKRKAIRVSSVFGDGFAIGRTIDSGRRPAGALR